MVERDPARIEPILFALGQAWRTHPHLRLTQLVWLLASTGETAPKFFYTEDEDLRWHDVPVSPPRRVGFCRQCGKPVVVLRIQDAPCDCLCHTGTGPCKADYIVEWDESANTPIARPPESRQT